MSDPDDGLKLEDLARVADVSPRTIRYYVQRGLLPAPRFRGRDTSYGPEHGVRLRLIKKLQALHLPLDVIQAELEKRSEDEINLLADTDLGLPELGLPEPASASAKDFEDTVGEPRHWTRWVLSPGLELHLAEPDHPMSPGDRRLRALAAKIREIVEASSPDPRPVQKAETHTRQKKKVTTRK